MADLRLIFTRHAEDMLVERSIDRSWVELTVREPELVERDPSRPDTVRAYRRIPERDSRVLRVAYIQSDESLRIVTVFFDRNQRRKLARLSDQKTN